MTEKIPPRQLILEAVVTCIEKYGIDKVTTRKIAQEAGTNIASINYYFRSKDDLVAEALSMTIKHMMEDVFAAIDNKGQSFEESLRSVFFYLLDGSIRFPGVSTAHLYKAVIEKKYDSLSAKAIIQVYERLAVRAAQEYPRKNKQEMSVLLAQILSSIMFSLLAPAFFPVAQEYRLTNSENAKNVAANCVKIFLNNIQ